MSEVVSGQNLTVIVLDEGETEALRNALLQVDMHAKLGNQIAQETIDKLISLADALVG